jgi:small subunit ribosomal protein S21
MRREKGRKSFGLTVVVEDGKFEKALRLFKKKVDDSGLLKEVRDREAYVKPTTRRKMAANAARRRWQKKLAMESLPKKEY